MIFSSDAALFLGPPLTTFLWYVSAFCFLCEWSSSDLSLAKNLGKSRGLDPSVRLTLNFGWPKRRVAFRTTLVLYRIMGSWCVAFRLKAQTYAKHKTLSRTICIVLLASIPIILVIAEQTHVVEKQPLGGREETAWPFRFTAINNEESCKSIGNLTFTLRSSASVDLANE